MMEELIRRTALMCAKWQSVGFCHGVLNTDNMSIIGVTLDYGPYGFLEYFDQKHICNHSDNEGRYRYEAQPEICLWNLQMLRSVLVNYLDLTSEKMKEKWDKNYYYYYQEEMRKKLGLETANPQLVTALFKTMQECRTDFTNCFRILAELKKDGSNQEHIVG
jgi:uncharacterized protein YdiU (UPF0061 family)